jgi:hypothetical protein
LITVERLINSPEKGSSSDELKIHVPKSLKVKLVALNPSTAIKTNTELKNKERKIVSVIPFAELKCSNLQEVYRISKSFVKDLEEAQIKSEIRNYCKWKLEKFYAGSTFDFQDILEIYDNIVFV